MITMEILLELKEYIDDRLGDDFLLSSSESTKLSFCAPLMSNAVYEYSEVDNFISSNKKPPFNKILFELIDKKGAADIEIYKKAGIDRRLFSKIRANKDYRPGKSTIIALALALELSKEESEHLLSSAGYTLSDSETFDLVIQFCLDKKIYNINDVNLALDYFSLKPLTGAEL